VKKLWIVPLVSLLVACSSSNELVITNPFSTWDSQFTDVAQLSAELRSEQIKPVQLNNLPFQMASLDSNNKIDITADSPIVNFPEGNSFVAALLIPEHISTFTFALESKAGSTVFVPSVIFLDENMQQVARIDDAQFNAKGFFTIEKALTAAMTRASRYIVVYSKDSDLGGRSELVDVAREYELAKGKELSEYSFPKLYAKHSPIGKITVRFKDVFFSVKSLNTGLVTKNTRVNKTTMLETTPLGETPTILSDTEAFYLEQISKAIKENNLSRAVSLVEEAERAGSKKAKLHYTAELGKQQ
jgi:maltose operon protein